MSVCQVRIWVTTSEIWQHIAPHQVLNSKQVTKDLLSVWSTHAMHTVKTHGKVWPCDKSFDLVKVEETLHKVDIEL